jgi:phenylacetic acid degradation operon negative regulatory protein
MNDQLRRRAIGAPAARSVLLTVLGEYVLPNQGQAWRETLVKALGTLGYKPQAARQAISRSTAAGWLRTERHGRRSRVHLTPEVSEMLTAGARRIYSFGRPSEWDGRWLLVMTRVPELRRELRHQMRTQLAWAGFGSLGSGIWISPDIERESELAAIAAGDSAAALQSFHAHFGALGNPEDIIANAWDLDAVADSYREFVARFRALRPRTPEAAFEAQTRLVHAWRKFPFLDPDLPESMLPRTWPRSMAHALFTDRHAAWSAAAQSYFSSLNAGEPAAEAKLRAA